jgi:hypothetical protein
MWTALYFAVALATYSPIERVLLVEDGVKPNLERHLVHRQLMHHLLQDPSVDLLHDLPTPLGLEKGVLLHGAAQLHLANAQRHLQSLNPQAAAGQAAAATLRLARVAVLTGDVAPLAHALSLQAAAYLYLGSVRAADRTLVRLLSLDAHWQPDTALYNPAMVARVTRLRQQLPQWQQTQCNVDPGDAQAAVFIDGHFKGFGPTSVQVINSVDHYVWVVPAYGEPTGMLMHAHHCGDLAIAHVPYASAAAPKHIQQILAVSRLPHGDLDPHHPALAARQVDTVLVLAYANGGLTLTTFDLKRGQRRHSEVPALITNSWDVNRTADALRAPAPALVALPDGL